MIYYDFDTTNESAIEVANQLKELGVKNYYIHLALYDKDLIGVNPFDEDNLSLRMKAKIKKEIRINLWYFLREIVRIKETGGMTRYKFHRANIAQAFCFRLNLDVIELLPRQNGKTIGACCNYDWLHNFATINMDAIFSNKQLADSQLNISRLKGITELLPKYLKTHINEREDTDNLDNIRLAELNNNIRAVPSPRDISSAEKIGRGNTVACIWYDELAFLKFNKRVFDAAAFAYSKASEAAERNGSPHSRVITTTPNSLDLPEGAFCYSLIQSALPFDEEWYSWDEEDVKDFVKENSRNGFVHIQYSWKELGLTQEWYEQQCKLVNYDLLTIRREIELEWTLSSDNAIFTEEQLDYIRTFIQSPIGHFTLTTKEKKTYKFNVFEQLHQINKRSYIIAIDVAGGLSEDATVISIIDPLTYKTAASFKSNTIDTVELKDLLVELVTQLFHESVLVPERNNMGISLIHMLLRTEVAKNLYYHIKGEDKGETKEEGVKSKKRSKEKSVKDKKRIRVYGVDTTAKAREIMIDEILNMIVNERQELCNNKDLFDEIKTLERDKRGKVQARSGLHDDVVMSYLIGLYMMLYGKNRNKFIKVTYIGEDEEGNISALANKSVKKNIHSMRNIMNGNPNSNFGGFYSGGLTKSQLMEMERLTGMKVNNPLYTKDEDSQVFSGSSNTKAVKNISRFRKLLH